MAQTNAERYRNWYAREKAKDHAALRARLNSHPAALRRLERRRLYREVLSAIRRACDQIVREVRVP